MASILKKFHCEMLEMSIRFDSKDFQKKEFVKDVASPPRETNFAYSFGPRTKSRNEHAHLFIDLDRPGEQSFLAVTYHPGEWKAPDVREPYLEDMSSWLGGFFKTKELRVRFTVAFEYKKGYKSQIPLDYPLLINSKWFKDAKIGGYEVNFPPDAYIERAIISQRDKSLTILLYAGLLVELSDFDVHKAVRVFSTYADALVTKEGKHDVTTHD